MFVEPVGTTHEHRPIRAQRNRPTHRSLGNNGTLCQSELWIMNLWETYSKGGIKMNCDFYEVKADLVWD